MSALDDRLVSVIVPTYDRRHCVMDAVDSVLAQSHRHVECIVVDDGSVDGTVDAVTTACAADDRVRVFAQAQEGVSAARNRGLREARGEYVTFLDSDDVMPPGRVRRQLELLATEPCDAVFGSAELMMMPGVAAPTWLEQRPEWRRGPCWISLLAAASAFRAVDGFDETLQTGEDADLLVRLRYAGLRTLAVDETFVRRRIFGDNLTYTLDADHWAIRDAIRRNLLRSRAAGQ